MGRGGIGDGRGGDDEDRAGDGIADNLWTCHSLLTASKGLPAYSYAIPAMTPPVTSVTP